MEITERLRNTPTGLIVLVGDMKIVVEKIQPVLQRAEQISRAGDASSGTRMRDFASTARLAWPI
jgi:hypothetical protein